MKNLLIAKRHNDKLYYDLTLETPLGKTNFGRVVMRDGKHISVNIDDVLSRSNWDLLEPHWRNSVDK